MEQTLKGKVALITGAGSQRGFGKGMALSLAKRGCNIVVSDIDVEGAQKTAAAVRALGPEALVIKSDITKMSEAKSMVEQALKKFSRIDILINNAGWLPETMPFVDTPEKNWENTFNLNITGVFNVTKAVLPSMIKNKYGRIINISSGAGISGMPGCLQYGASKGAVIAFTKGLAREVLSQGIMVNSIAPGLRDISVMKSAMEMVPPLRATSPEMVGELAAFLVSDASNFVGQTLLMDGGLG